MKLGKTDESNPAHWFAFAAERLLAADLLSQHDGTSASSVEALQEAAERYLKGYLIAKGWTLKRTHDLKVLGGTRRRTRPISSASSIWRTV